MANKDTLQKALAEAYSLPFFSQNVLQPVFGKNLSVYRSGIPMPVNPSEERLVQSIKKYGELRLTDYKQLDLYEIALEKNIIVERNKVGIGSVVKKLIAGSNAVLANFYHPDDALSSWRFSYSA